MQGNLVLSYIAIRQFQLYQLLDVKSSEYLITHGISGTGWMLISIARVCIKIQGAKKVSFTACHSGKL